MNTAPAIISVKRYQKAYDLEIAVEDLTFRVFPGQVLGLIGPNGAGKTTTLKAIAGIIPISGGTLTVNGFDVERDSIHVKKISAYVPDDPQLFNDLTVAQHFAFTASVYNVNGWQEKMSTIVERFDLSKKLNSRCSDLSRGMRQKLAIGCAYLFEPKALLLDEPMTGLDPRGIRVLKETITERANQGIGVIISSHLLAMVEDICTDVLILKEGCNQFFGDLNSLKQKFSNANQEQSLEELFFSAVSN
ncbi:MAG: ABC transporter ATP-binding protein [Planctomycetota bacterium]